MGQWQLLSPGKLQLYNIDGDDISSSSKPVMERGSLAIHL